MDTKVATSGLTVNDVIAQMLQSYGSTPNGQAQLGATYTQLLNTFLGKSTSSMQRDTTRSSVPAGEQVVQKRVTDFYISSLTNLSKRAEAFSKKLESLQIPQRQFFSKEVPKDNYKSLIGEGTDPLPKKIFSVLSESEGVQEKILHILEKKDTTKQPAPGGGLSVVDGALIGAAGVGATGIIAGVGGYLLSKLKGVFPKAEPIKPVNQKVTPIESGRDRQERLQKEKASKTETKAPKAAEKVAPKAAEKTLEKSAGKKLMEQVFGKNLSAGAITRKLFTAGAMLMEAKELSDDIKKEGWVEGGESFKRRKWEAVRDMPKGLTFQKGAGGFVKSAFDVADMAFTAPVSIPAAILGNLESQLRVAEAKKNRSQRDAFLAEYGDPAKKTLGQQTMRLQLAIEEIKKANLKFTDKDGKGDVERYKLSKVLEVNRENSHTVFMKAVEAMIKESRDKRSDKKEAQEVQKKMIPLQPSRPEVVKKIKNETTAIKVEGIDMISKQIAALNFSREMDALRKTMENLAGSINNENIIVQPQQGPEEFHPVRMMSPGEIQKAREVYLT